VLAAFRKMAEAQQTNLAKITELPEPTSFEDNDSDSGSVDSTPVDIKIESITAPEYLDWTTLEVNNIEEDEDAREVGKPIKLERPKYKESDGPIESWLHNEILLLSLSGERNERRMVVKILDLLPISMVNHCLSEFRSAGIKTPTMKNLEVALKSANSKMIKFDEKIRTIQNAQNLMNPLCFRFQNVSSTCI